MHTQPEDICRASSLAGDQGLLRGHDISQAAEWILPSGLNLDNVKCKEKSSGTSFTYLKLPKVCHLVDLLFNSKLTCLNTTEFQRSNMWIYNSRHRSRGQHFVIEVGCLG